MQGKTGKLNKWEVALAVSSSMIGLSLLYFPELFMRAGLVVAIIALVVLAAMMSYTCTLWSEHLAYNETDIGEVVMRVLKKKVYIVFSISSGMALCLLTMVIFLMISQLIYTLLVQIFQFANLNFKYRKNTSQIHFQQFSIQYLGLIIMIPLSFLLCLKNIDKVLKITKYSAVLMGVFFIQTFIFFIQNMTTSRVKENGIKLHPSSFSETVGLLSTILFAFVSHPSISPILKNAKNPMQNTKSIYIAYAFTTILFVLVGTFGGIGLVGRKKQAGTSVISYFSNEILSYTMGIPILIYLFSIFSIYPYVARNQILGLIQFLRKQPVKRKYHYHFSVVLIGALVASILLNLNPELIISFIGAVMCWLACFLLPCMIRLKQGKPRYDIQSLISQQELIPQRVRLNVLQKVWIWFVVAAGTLLMIAQFYYIIEGLVEYKS